MLDMARQTSTRCRGNRTGAPAGVGRKFTAEQIIAIRKKYAEGLATQVEIAAELGVHQGYVSLIMRRQVWKTV